MGRKGKRKDPDYWVFVSQQDQQLCPLCGRPMPPGSFDEHHLIPKTFGGTQTIPLHKICHDKLHHTFSEREMANWYHSLDRILEDEQIVKFVKWVRKQPNDFYSKHRDTKERNKKRR